MMAHPMVHVLLAVILSWVVKSVICLILQHHSKASKLAKMTDSSARDFDFHKIGTHQPSNLLIRSDPTTRHFLEVGTTSSPAVGSMVHWQALINAGRTGSPGLELILTVYGRANLPSLTAKIVLEPGVIAAPLPRASYNLDVGKADFLGKGGGGGHMYDHDPLSVHRFKPLHVLKRTWRMNIVSHGFVCHDLNTLECIQSRLHPASADSRMIMKLLTATASVKFDARLYFEVPAAVTFNFTDNVWPYFISACENRTEPYHQYSSTNLHLDMDPLPRFRNYMYHNLPATQWQTSAMGSPVMQIEDSIGSTWRRTRSIVNQVAIVRECQAVEEFCLDLGNGPHEIKVLRSCRPVLAKAARGMPPTAIRHPSDPHIYYGYVYIHTMSRLMPIHAPPRGSLFCIEWLITENGQLKRSGKIAYGFVIAPHAAMQKAQATFAVALWIKDQDIVNDATTDVGMAQKSKVELSYIQNRHVPQIMLARMKTFARDSLIPSFLAFQFNVMRHAGLSTYRDDLTRGPKPDPGKLAQLDSDFQRLVKSVLARPWMNNLQSRERRIIEEVPKDIAGKMQMIQCKIGNHNFRGVCALAMILAGTGHRLLFVVDDPADRARLCWELYRVFNENGTTDTESDHIWKAKKLISYITAEVQYDSRPSKGGVSASSLSDTNHPTRPALNLFFKVLLDDPPTDAHIHDKDLYLAPARSSPAYQTPQVMSWADYLQVLFKNREPASNVYREIYYRVRANILDGQLTDPASAQEDLRGLSELRTKVLARASVVVTDSATAMGEDIKAAFNQPVIFLCNSNRVTFATGASVLLNYPNHQASFILGNPDGAPNPMGLASLDKNEALLTLKRSLWDTYCWVGGLD